MTISRNLSILADGANSSGVLQPTNGGTGTTTLTGYVYGNGTGAMTASTTIPGSAVSGNISGSAGSVANALTAGTGISYSSGTTYNGSAALTISIPQAISTSSSVQFGSFGVGTAASGTTGEIRATNNITAFYSSDAKYKTNVRPIPSATDIVMAIGGDLFDWTDEYIAAHGGADGYFVQKEDFGVIAQKVLEVFPLAVRIRPDGSLAVDYQKLSALAFASIIELDKRIKTLEGKE